MRAEQAETIRVDGRDVKITRPEKVLFPEDGITKGDLIRYYQRIGPRMLPYLKGRPLALQRYPDGTFVVRDYGPGETKYLVHSPDDTLIHDLENVGSTTMRFVTVELRH